MKQGILVLIVCLLLLITTNYQFVKDNCKILLLGTVLMITYLYNHSDIMEGAGETDTGRTDTGRTDTGETDNSGTDTGGTDPGYKSFYAYFGRESDEADSKQSPSAINPNPPYYTPSNINLADLKGELSFFKNEFIPDSKPYNNNDDVLKMEGNTGYNI